MPIPGNRRWPMVRVLIPFAFGILIRFYMPIGLYGIYAGFIIFLLSVVGYGMMRSDLQYRMRFFAGFLIHCLLLFGGMLLLFISQPENKRAWLGNTRLTNAVVIARLTDNPKVGQKSLTAKADLLRFQDSAGWHPVTGRIVVSFLKTETFKTLSAGQAIAFRKLPTLIPNTSNPGGFDYQRYMLLQGVMHQVFLIEDEVRFQGVERDAFLRLLDWLQQYVLNAIRKNIRGKEEPGLAEALLIGYRNDLDRDLVQSYSNTGVVHVIAISGLHLALIYLLLGKLCELLKLNNRFLKPLVVIAGLWIFALLAGGSPSVVRSAVMFSVIVVGELINRKAHILNSLAASAFVLLCYNPLWLWDLGFQLSYIAVLSLALTATPVYQWIYVSNPVLDNIWKLISVTISAQVLTTPLSLLNFHKFPMMFLFTNCICVPLSSLILLGELLLCLVAPFRPIASFLGNLLHDALRFMNNVVRYFEQYPVSNFQPVQLSVLQTLLLYFVIGLLLIPMCRKSQNIRIASGMSILLFCVLRLISFQSTAKQSTFIVYNIPGAMVADVFIGRDATSFQLLGSKKSPNLIRQYTGPARIQRRIRQLGLTSYILPGNELREVNGLKLYFLQQKDNPGSAVSDTIDIMIVSHNSLYRSAQRISGLKLRLVVADATNSRAAIQSYSRLFHKLGIPFHAVSSQGAFVRNLN